MPRMSKVEIARKQMRSARAQKAAATRRTNREQKFQLQEADAPAADMRISAATTLHDHVWLPPERTIEDRLKDAEHTIKTWYEYHAEQVKMLRDRMDEYERYILEDLQKHERRLQAIEKKLG